MNNLGDILNTNNEIIPMIYDILRTITMQIVVQSLVVASNPSITFMSSGFIQVTLFLILGTMVFWMIIYKFLSKNNIINQLLSIDNNDEKSI
tara:strand:- start:893 stop:1168 length:276 start_codon:yes stop_codon:yes gene_type:complete